MARKEKLKKYQKEKFEHYKKIKDLKMEENSACIDLRVDGLDDIVSKFSVSGEMHLKQEFYNAIERNVSFIPLDYPLVIEIYSSNLSAEDKILVRKLIKDHFSLMCIDAQVKLKYIRRKGHFFLICGIIGLILSLFLYKFNYLIYVKDILSFISSFSLWEYSELLLFEQDDLKEAIIKYKHLINVRVVYIKDNG